MTSRSKWIPALAGLLMMLGSVASAADSAVAQGRRLYLEYCASCHGLTGEGDGPVARALSTPPANLRRLSERFGNPLPEDQVVRFIDGRTTVKAHGPRDMPVWGQRFYTETRNESVVQARLAALVAYLQSIQTGARHAWQQLPGIEDQYANR
jgi:mono/diheme cytochrome c family protein